MKIPRRSKQGHSPQTVTSLLEVGVSGALSALGLRDTPYRKRLEDRALGYLRQPKAMEAYNILMGKNRGRDYVHFPAILLECALASEPWPPPLSILFDRKAVKKRLVAAKLMRKTVAEIRDLQAFPFIRENILSSLAFRRTGIPSPNEFLSWEAGGPPLGLLQLFGPEEMRSRGASVLPGIPDTEVERIVDALVDLFDALLKRSGQPRRKDGRPTKDGKNRLLLSLHDRFQKDFKKPLLPAIAQLMAMTFGAKPANPSVLSSTVSRLKSPARKKTVRRRP